MRKLLHPVRAPETPQVGLSKYEREGRPLLVLGSQPIKQVEGWMRDWLLVSHPEPLLAKTGPVPRGGGGVSLECRSTGDLQLQRETQARRVPLAWGLGLDMGPGVSPSPPAA